MFPPQPTFLLDNTNGDQDNDVGTQNAMLTWEERQRRARTVRLLVTFLTMLLLMDGDPANNPNHKSPRNHRHSSSGGNGKAASKAAQEEDHDLMKFRSRHQSRLREIIDSHPRYVTLQRQNSIFSAGNNVDSEPAKSEGRTHYYYPRNATGYYRGVWSKNRTTVPVSGEIKKGKRSLLKGKKDGDELNVSGNGDVTETVSGEDDPEIIGSDSSNRDNVQLSQLVNKELAKKNESVGVFLLPEGIFADPDPPLETLKRKTNGNKTSGNLKKFSGKGADGTATKWKTLLSEIAGEQKKTAPNNKKEKSLKSRPPSFPLKGNQGKLAIQFSVKAIPGMSDVSFVEGQVKLFDDDGGLLITTAAPPPSLYSPSVVSSGSAPRGGNDAVRSVPRRESSGSLMLRSRGVIVHSIGRISMVANADPSRTVFLIRNDSGTSGGQVEDNGDLYDAKVPSNREREAKKVESDDVHLPNSLDDVNELTITGHASEITREAGLGKPIKEKSTAAGGVNETGENLSRQKHPDVSGIRRHDFSEQHEEDGHLSRQNEMVSVIHAGNHSNGLYASTPGMNKSVVATGKVGIRSENETESRKSYSKIPGEMREGRRLRTSHETVALHFGNLFDLYFRAIISWLQQFRWFLVSLVDPYHMWDNHYDEDVHNSEGNGEQFYMIGEEEGPVSLEELSSIPDTLTLQRPDTSTNYKDENSFVDYADLLPQDKKWHQRDQDATSADTFFEADERFQRREGDHLLSDGFERRRHLAVDSLGTSFASSDVLSLALIAQSTLQTAPGGPQKVSPGECEYELSLDVEPLLFQPSTDTEAKKKRAKQNVRQKQQRTITDVWGVKDAEPLSDAEKEQLVVRISGMLLSPNCDFSASLNSTALRINWTRITTRAINYSFTMMLICLSQIVLLLRQLLHSQTNSVASRVSMLTVGWQCLLDAIWCIVHILLCLVMQPLFTAFASVAFFKLLMFCVIEMKYMQIIYQARQASEGQHLTAEDMRRQIAVLQTRFYGGLFAVMVLYWNLRHWWQVLVVLLHSFWMPQILRNIYTEARKPLHPYYLYGMSITRLVAPIYIFGVKGNFIRDMNPDFAHNTVLCQVLVLWVGLQAAVLVMQGKYGARFMIPARFLPPKFDYSRPIPSSLLPNRLSPGSDVEIGPPSSNLDSTGPRNRLNGSTGSRPRTMSADSNSGTSTAGASNSLDCVICYSPIDINNRRGYMLAPCDHIFHRHCLEQWMEVKMECPICRTELPPI